MPEATGNDYERAGHSPSQAPHGGSDDVRAGAAPFNLHTSNPAVESRIAHADPAIAVPAPAAAVPAPAAAVSGVPASREIAKEHGADAGIASAGDTVIAQNAHTGVAQGADSVDAGPAGSVASSAAPPPGAAYASERSTAVVAGVRQPVRIDAAAFDAPGQVAPSASDPQRQPVRPERRARAKQAHDRPLTATGAAPAAVEWRRSQQPETSAATRASASGGPTAGPGGPAYRHSDRQVSALFTQVAPARSGRTVRVTTGPPRGETAHEASAPHTPSAPRAPSAPLTPTTRRTQTAPQQPPKQRDVAATPPGVAATRTAAPAPTPTPTPTPASTPGLEGVPATPGSLARRTLGGGPTHQRRRRSQATGAAEAGEAAPASRHRRTVEVTVEIGTIEIVSDTVASRPARATAPMSLQDYLRSRDQS